MGKHQTSTAGKTRLKAILTALAITVLALVAPQALASNSVTTVKSQNFCVDLIQKSKGDDVSAGVSKVSKANAQDAKEKGASATKLPQTPENAILLQAIPAHFNATGVKVESVKVANKNFVKIVDPLGFLFTQNEYKNLTEIEDSSANLILQNTILKANRIYYAKIAEVAYKRLSSLVGYFASDKKFRDEVLEMARTILTSPEKSIKERPTSPEEITAHFKRFLAQEVANLMSEDYQKAAGLSAPMIEREAFLMMVRNKRPLILRHLFKIEDQNLPFLIAKAYVKTLDPHTDLMLPDEAEKFMEHSAGSIAGIGVNIQQHIKGIRITHIVEGSRAKEHGLEIGDIITHIKTAPDNPAGRQITVFGKDNWIIVRGVPADMASKAIRGEPNTFVTVRVLRNGEPHELTIPRVEISRQDQLIHSKVVTTAQGDVAYVEFDSFYQDSADQLKEVILQLKAKHDLKGLILSVRGNGGGSVVECAKILGFFVPQGPAMIFHGKAINEVVSIPKDNQVIWDGPLLVMTDATSASASEALAQSLQDYKRAIVIGEETTHGKGSMQNTQELGNLLLKVTRALYYTASGRSPQFKGVQSDIILPLKTKPAYDYERNYPNALNPEPLDNATSSKSLDQVAMPNRDQIMTTLKEKSNVRTGAQKAEGLTDQDIYDINTDEAFKIMEDMIPLIKK